MSTFTVNKNLQMPANGSFNNDWDQPVNLNFSEIDAAFGGRATINITGVVAGTYTLTISQYQPPIIVFTGTLTANLVYVLPPGVGGIWSVQNFTTGAFTITFAVSGGTGFALPQGFRILALSDGFGTDAADQAPAVAAQANAEAFATAADAVVTTNANAFATAAANTAQANAIATAAIATNLTSGTVPNSVLPNPGVGPGVTIAADPGTTPSGAPGQIFYYY
jgi:hypothetical protein